MRGPEVEDLLEGRSVAIDAAIWLYEAQCQQHLVKHFGKVGASVKIFFERCSRFLRKGVLPVIVLEGQGGGRSERRFGCARLGATFAAQGEVRQLLCSMGIPCVDAEGEAEATCAALTQAGVCDFVASSDFDSLLFGARRVLRSLHLADRSVGSECELWDSSQIDAVAGLDRDSLIAAAFMAGCDYDLRRGAGDELSSGSNGVRGVGVKQAMQTALELRRSGDTLSALVAMADGVQVDRSEASQLASQGGHCRGCKRCGHGNVSKKIHGKLGCSLCGTSVGCLPRIEEGSACECTYCVQVAAAGGKKRIAAARTLVRTASNASEDSSSSRGARAVVSQYRRHVRVRHPASGFYSWQAFDEAKLKVSLSSVYAQKAIPDKLQPLHFELCLRRIGSECPKQFLSSVRDLQDWARKANLRFCPLSAKRKVGSEGTPAPYVLVTWIASADDSRCPLVLSASVRRARMSLARDCRLLGQDSLRPCTLLAAWKTILTNCPEHIRRDQEALLSWGRDRDLDLIPVAAIALKPGKVKVWWRHCESGEHEAKVAVIVPSTEADTFGLVVSEKASAQKRPKSQQMAGNQRQITDFFRRPGAATQCTPSTQSQRPTADLSDGEREANEIQEGTLSPETPPRRIAAPQTPPRAGVADAVADAVKTPCKRKASDRIQYESLTPEPPRTRRRFQSDLLTNAVQHDASKPTP